MTEPQVWVLIGVFAASIIGMMGWQTILFNRTLESSIGRVDAKIDAKFEIIEAKFEVVEAKFEVVATKIDNLDRDVQALTRHVFGADHD